MSKRFCYRSEGEQPSIGIGWWLIILSAVAMWYWKYYPLSWL
ncbi:MAG: hypothetical protein WD425_08145 [Nitrospirales bacterium]